MGDQCEISLLIWMRINRDFFVFVPHGHGYNFTEVKSSLTHPIRTPLVLNMALWLVENTRLKNTICMTFPVSIPEFCTFSSSSTILRKVIHSYIFNGISHSFRWKERVDLQLRTSKYTRFHRKCANHCPCTEGAKQNLTPRLKNSAITAWMKINISQIWIFKEVMTSIMTIFSVVIFGIWKSLIIFSHFFMHHFFKI